AEECGRWYTDDGGGGQTDDLGPIHALGDTGASLLTVFRDVDHNEGNVVLLRQIADFARPVLVIWTERLAIEVEVRVGLAMGKDRVGRERRWRARLCDEGSTVITDVAV